MWLIQFQEGFAFEEIILLPETGHATSSIRLTWELGNTDKSGKKTLNTQHKWRTERNGDDVGPAVEGVN